MALFSFYLMTRINGEDTWCKNTNSEAQIKCWNKKIESASHIQPEVQKGEMQLITQLNQ